MEQSYEALCRGALTKNLDDNIARFRELLRANVNSDAQFRSFEAAGRRLCLIYMEGMADDRRISDLLAQLLIFLCYKIQFIEHVS